MQHQFERIQMGRRLGFSWYCSPRVLLVHWFLAWLRLSRQLWWKFCFQIWPGLIHGKLDSKETLVWGAKVNRRLDLTRPHKMPERKCMLQTIHFNLSCILSYAFSKLPFDSHGRNNLQCRIESISWAAWHFAHSCHMLHHWSPYSAAERESYSYVPSAPCLWRFPDMESLKSAWSQYELRTPQVLPNSGTEEIHPCPGFRHSSKLAADCVRMIVE